MMTTVMQLSFFPSFLPYLTHPSNKACMPDSCLLPSSRSPVLESTKPTGILYNFHFLIILILIIYTSIQVRSMSDKITMPLVMM